MNNRTLWTRERQPIVLVGPTATGKTDAAIALANQIQGEIVNADSVQVYRGMNIGAAKPTRAEQQQARFHLLDVTTPDQPFTVADWKIQAEAAIEDCFQRDRQPIVCGGTGLYVRALLDDWSLAATPADATVRQQLEAERNMKGTSSLYAELEANDPRTAARLHPNDAVRIIRALEVYRVTGKPISVYQAEDRQSRPQRSARRFGLDLPRPDLYARIDRRVDAMLAAGLEAEVRGLLSQGVSPEAGVMKTLGYKEMTAFVLGKMEYEAAVAAIKLNTRRFAKRQQTWFRADKQIHWIDVTNRNAAQIAAHIRRQLSDQAESADEAS